MSDQLYNLIMASVPDFYSGDQGEFQIPKSRFLEYTEDHIKEEFQSLDQAVIDRLKGLPAIFAVEDEAADARIGKIINIKVNSSNLRVKYKFDKDRYPLTSGVLRENRQKLGISDSSFEFHRGHWGVKECDLSDFYEEYLKSLTGIAHKLKNTNKKVQLIYAFNGTGKTRLSRALKNLIAPKNESEDDAEPSRNKFLYYNAFTEDLFYWDNDLLGDAEPKLKIQFNSFTDWILGVQGKGNDIISNFQHYTNDKLTPFFIEVSDSNGEKSYPEVTFSLERGDDTQSGNIKISKGEESNFIWSIFYTLLQQVVDIVNVVELDDRETDQFNQLEYVFIDDPVSSLDDNHVIELAVNLASVIKRSAFTNGQGLKFIITTHSPLFYNVLYNELGVKSGHILSRFDDGTYELEEKKGDSNKSFSYHLHIKALIELAIAQNNVQRYHFALIRNLYEKTANFLGYQRWSDLLPGDKKAYASRIMNFYPHNTLSNEEIAEPTEPEKAMVGLLLKNLDNYGYLQVEEENNAGTN